MKTHEQVIDPLRKAVKEAGGGLILLRSNNPRSCTYQITLPVPGYSANRMCVKKAFREFAVEPRDFYVEGPAWRFEYDDEFLTLGDWIVVHGEFILMLKYEVPSKYLRVDHVDSLALGDFNARYGVNYGA